MREILASPMLGVAALAAAALGLLLTLLSRRLRGKRTRSLVAEAVAVRAGALLPPRGSLLVPLLVVLAALGIGAALARPRWGILREKAERKGSDVILLLDTSASMRAADVSPSRFVLTKEAAASLLERIGPDRVALVACEGDAQTLVPLTMDLSAVGLFLDALEPGVGTLPGTSLAAGIAAASELFPGGAPAGRTCVLISDGEDLEGGVDEAVAKAKKDGITIHTVFVGTAEGAGAPVPATDAAGRPAGFKTDAGGKPVLSRPDPQLLREIAARTGGTFSVVTTGRSDLDGVARAIDRAATRPLGETFVTEREERFQLPLAVAVAAVALLLFGVPEAFRIRAARQAREDRRGTPRSPRAEALAAALLLALLPFLAGTARAQIPAPEPSPAPSPAPTPALPTGLASRPPFTTARSEARKGAKALEQKQEDEALRRFAHEAQLAPKDPTGPYNLGTAYAQAGRPDEAVSRLAPVCRQAMRSETVADACYNAGSTYFGKQQFGEAADSFRAALRTRPGDADAAYNYELALRRLVEQQKQQQKQSQQQKQQKPGPTPPPQKKPDQQQQRDQEEKDFREKANMSRDKAEQILAAISRADEDEQKKSMAAKRSKRHVERDW